MFIGQEREQGSEGVDGDWLEVGAGQVSSLISIL